MFQLRFAFASAQTFPKGERKTKAENERENVSFVNRFCVGAFPAVVEPRLPSENSLKVYEKETSNVGSRPPGQNAFALIDKQLIPIMLKSTIEAPSATWAEKARRYQLFTCLNSYRLDAGHVNASKPSFDRFLVNCNTEKANQLETNRFTYASHLMIIVLYLQRLCVCVHAFMIIKSSHSITNSIMRLGEKPKGSQAPAECFRGRDN